MLFQWWIDLQAFAQIFIDRCIHLREPGSARRDSNWWRPKI